jgi:hypothetical protein
MKGWRLTSVSRAPPGVTPCTILARARTLGLRKAKGFFDFMLPSHSQWRPAPAPQHPSEAAYGFTVAAAAHARLAQSYAARRRLSLCHHRGPAQPTRETRARACPHLAPRHDGGSGPLHAERPAPLNLAPTTCPRATRSATGPACESTGLRPGGGGEKADRTRRHTVAPRPPASRVPTHEPVCGRK